MVDLIGPVSLRAVCVWCTRVWLASLAFTVAALLIGQPARAEASESAIVASDAGDSELQQPKHMLPLGDTADSSDSALSDATSTDVVEAPPAGPLEQLPGERHAAPPFDAIQFRMHSKNRVRQANFQTQDQIPFPPLEKRAAPEAPRPPEESKSDPCASLVDRPFSEFGISIAMSGKDFPDNQAIECWEPINASSGPLAVARPWGPTTFAWNATCLCHRPLYFEEINLERYGYGCCETLQPAASAAHFFATIPTLPYCIATDCPCECIYTLGHYRPGSCNPWQCHWPRWSTRAALAEGGVWTGMVFLIP